jgi:hypothetical protein
MNIRPIMTRRFCLSVGVALAVAAVLVTHRGGPAREPEGEGVVFVYFPSLCATPGDASDCHEIPRPARPAFASMAACSAYADTQLRLENNPRLMASCMKQREG